VNAPIGQPPLDALPPDAPATVEDVRASRRWTWVALAWAIAASAIAVIALVTSSDNSSSNGSQTTTDLTPRIDKLEQDTNARLDAFSRRLTDKASSADLQKLDKRLTTVEDDLTRTKDDLVKQTDAVTQLQTDVKDLQQRVGDLESKQQGQGTTTTP
jgi:septal ring factor EnvC (AmiA/AmiB activator)